MTRAVRAVRANVNGAAVVSYIAAAAVAVAVAAAAQRPNVSLDIF